MKTPLESCLTKFSVVLHQPPNLLLFHQRLAPIPLAPAIINNITGTPALYPPDSRHDHDRNASSPPAADITGSPRTLATPRDPAALESRLPKGTGLLSPPRFQLSSLPNTLHPAIRFITSINVFGTEGESIATSLVFTPNLLLVRNWGFV